MNENPFSPPSRYSRDEFPLPKTILKQSVLTQSWVGTCCASGAWVIFQCVLLVAVSQSTQSQMPAQLVFWTGSIVSIILSVYAIATIPTSSRHLAVYFSIVTVSLQVLISVMLIRAH